MASNRSLEPPFSPVLLAGLLMRPLPLAPLQAVLDLALATMQRRHAKVFSRLAAQGEPLFLIDPVDLPVAFKLHFRKAGPKLTALRDKVAADATAAIHGPFLTLLTLLEGRIDGDALFFTRELIVEGDTEAVVALRNAVDGAGIELTRDLPAALGPLAGMARGGLRLAERVYQRMDRDLALVHAAITAPLRLRGAATEARIGRMEQKLDTLSRAVERRGSTVK
jgi:O2-independent ubiquinone biosynthesis accessory factor UbiT